MQQQPTSSGEWVVRAGIATREMLIRGYVEHRSVPGLFGFSVQYHPGASVDELARAGHFPNAQVSYATDRQLAAALAPLGYQLRLVASPGQGYHHTFCVLYDTSGTVVRTPLPVDAADAISATFVRIPNLHVKHP